MEVVDNLKGAVIVCHRVLFTDTGLTYPQGTAGQELLHLIDVAVQRLGLLAAGLGQRAVILDRTAHGLPPELTASEVRQVTRIGARVDERAQLLHGAGCVLEGAQKLLAQQAVAVLIQTAALFLVHAIQNVCLGYVKSSGFKQGTLYQILYRLDLDDLVRLIGKVLFNVCDGIGHYRLLIVSSRYRGQSDGALDKAAVIGYNFTRTFFYILYSHVFGLLPDIQNAPQQAGASISFLYCKRFCARAKGQKHTKFRSKTAQIPTIPSTPK